MLGETDLTACAQTMIRQYGAYTDWAIGARIAEHAGIADFEGIAMWRDIGERARQLQKVFADRHVISLSATETRLADAVDDEAVAPGILKLPDAP